MTELEERLAALQGQYSDLAQAYESQSRIAVALDASSRLQLESTDNEFSRNTAIGEISCTSPQKAPGFDSCSEMRPNATFAQATTEALGSIADQENVRFSHHP
jgi:hypothetical protein